MTERYELTREDLPPNADSLFSLEELYGIQPADVKFEHCVHLESVLFSCRRALERVDHALLRTTPTDPETAVLYREWYASHGKHIEPERLREMSRIFADEFYVTLGHVSLCMMSFALRNNPSTALPPDFLW